MSSLDDQREATTAKSECFDVVYSDSSIFSAESAPLHAWLSSEFYAYFGDDEVIPLVYEMGNVESSAGYPDLEDIELTAKKACLRRYRDEQAVQKDNKDILKKRQEICDLFHRAKIHRYHRILVAVTAVGSLPVHLQQDILQQSGVCMCHCIYVSLNRSVPVGHYQHSNCRLRKYHDAKPLSELHPFVRALTHADKTRNMLVAAKHRRHEVLLRERYLFD